MPLKDAEYLSHPFDSEALVSEAALFGWLSPAIGGLTGERGVPFDFSNTLNVAGAVTHEDTLDVAGPVTFGDTLDVADVATFHHGIVLAEPLSGSPATAGILVEDGAVAASGRILDGRGVECAVGLDLSTTVPTDFSLRLPGLDVVPPLGSIGVRIKGDMGNGSLPLRAMFQSTSGATVISALPASGSIAGFQAFGASNPAASPAAHLAMTAAAAQLASFGIGGATALPLQVAVGPNTAPVIAAQVSIAGRWTIGAVTDPDTVAPNIGLYVAGTATEPYHHILLDNRGGLFIRDGAGVPISAIYVDATGTVVVGDTGVPTLLAGEVTVGDVGDQVSFYGEPPVARQTVTGTRTGTLAQLQTVVGNLLARLDTLGVVTDATS